MQQLRNFSPSKPAQAPIVIEANRSAGNIESRPSPALPLPAGIDGGPMQLLGMDPAVVVAAVILDFMLSALDWMSFGLFFIFSLIAAIGFSIFAFNIQKEKFGDSHGLAFGKSALLFVLIILPTPIGGLLAVPSGIAGFLRNIQKKG